jgi:hypothetical protein
MRSITRHFAPGAIKAVVASPLALDRVDEHSGDDSDQDPGHPTPWAVSTG